jgi:hypothetical protein
MHLPDVGLVVWLIFLAIGLVSGMRRRMRAGSAQPLPQAVPVQPFVPQPVAPPPVAAPPVRAAPTPVPQPPAAAPVFPGTAPSGTSPIRGMFSGSGTLIRAIVAAEVLGPPKALQEQSVWSPRHSEPSI